jgi:hypothetical protein
VTDELRAIDATCVKDALEDIARMNRKLRDGKTYIGSGAVEEYREAVTLLLFDEGCQDALEGFIADKSSFYQFILSADFVDVKQLMERGTDEHRANRSACHTE